MSERQSITTNDKGTGIVLASRGEKKNGLKTQENREMILEKKPLSEGRKRAKLEGMVFLREVGMEKVLKGTNSLKELNKVTFVE